MGHTRTARTRTRTRTARRSWASRRSLRANTPVWLGPTQEWETLNAEKKMLKRASPPPQQHASRLLGCSLAALVSVYVCCMLVW